MPAFKCYDFCFTVTWFPWRQALVKSILCVLFILTHSVQTSAGWYGFLGWKCTKERPKMKSVQQGGKSQNTSFR